MRAVGLSGGVGPWRLVEPPGPTDPDLPILELAEAGDIKGALKGFRADAGVTYVKLLALPDPAMTEEFFDGILRKTPAGSPRRTSGSSAWTLRDTLRSYDGYARDNVAWGGDWDIDPDHLEVPTWLWFGDLDRMVPPSHGRWFADIPNSTLVPRTGKGPRKHSRPMLSLEKATRPEQVEAFFQRFPGRSVVVMPKLDGLSLALVYENGQLARAITRGDGTTGDDVTPLVRALADGLPTRVDAPGRVEVRGEAVMLRSTFVAYNANHPDKPLINPRNAAAGTLRAKDPASVAERRLQFLAFDLHTDPDGTDSDLDRALQALGFTAAEMQHCDDATAAQAVITTIEQQRNDLDYDLDGAVLRLADRGAFAAAGTRSNSPRGALAYKFAGRRRPP
ncbi:NAD-dependent DNA ligase-like protein [Kribbella sp. VKM Ac-2527]|uniref:NAD-dependent DNA ligase-like protein n=1 Tax=Kribbella caucasensis TaxID=2512215 RepID=A0A4R6J2X7_9ACTN|nr:hypothetical protein [Kribbella sp. VKM Ac-2527]TDO29659.1 NAD-dependent DNA ligase-like protein [Kribbella sp. VKM Ac-2527]